MNWQTVIALLVVAAAFIGLVPHIRRVFANDSKQTGCGSCPQSSMTPIQRPIVRPLVQIELKREKQSASTQEVMEAPADPPQIKP